MKIVTLACLLTVSSPVLAQEPASAPLDFRCFYGSLSFSPGAEVAIGNLRYICNIEASGGVWARSTNSKLIPQCLHSGELHGLGTMIGSGEEEVSCKPNGMWE